MIHSTLHSYGHPSLKVAKCTDYLGNKWNEADWFAHRRQDKIPRMIQYANEKLVWTRYF
jgi:hypothetical protein